MGHICALSLYINEVVSRERGSERTNLFAYGHHAQSFETVRG